VDYCRVWVLLAYGLGAGSRCWAGGLVPRDGKGLADESGRAPPPNAEII